MFGGESGTPARESRSSSLGCGVTLLLRFDKFGRVPSPEEVPSRLCDGSEGGLDDLSTASIGLSSRGRLFLLFGKPAVACAILLSLSPSSDRLPS